MGLIDRARRRGNHWGWRLRYWWMDKPGGLHTRIGLCVLCGFAAIALIVRALVVVPVALSAAHPQQSIIGVIIVLIIALLAAAIAIATMPKPKPPQPTQGDTPTVEDGQTVIDVLGTVWMDDEFVQAFKVVGKEPIKSSGGK